MNIENYTWVIGKIINRFWGIEYRYTVQNQEGKYFDSIVPLENEAVSEEAIAGLITAQLAKIDIPAESIIDPIEEAKTEKENKIQVFLVTKNLLDVNQEIWDIKSKAQIITEAQQI